MNEIEHLIISSTLDYSTDLVCLEFERRNEAYLRLNRNCLSEYKISYAYIDGALIIQINDTLFRVENNGLKSVYFRAPVFTRSSGKILSLQDQLRINQWNSFIRNLIVFDKAAWMNNPVNIYKAENKLYQLHVALQCGFQVPQGYAGNYYLPFVHDHEELIVKSLDTALFHDNGQELFTYTTRVTTMELEEESINEAPILVQEYLDPKIDIRVTVVGKVCLAVSILLDDKPIQGDWRKHNKDNLSYKPIQLPVEIEEKIGKLMSILGLSFGGIDLILSSKNYYFIEVNPTGEWGWLNTVGNVRIDRLISDYLISEGASDV